MASLQKLVFPGAMLQRGFWLYVCEMETVEGCRLLYVGRTGDSSSKGSCLQFSQIRPGVG